jgi:TatD DNase family protein
MFSFGAAILNEKSPAHEIIQKIAPHLFFLETDAAEISIKKVYEQAAFLRKSEWSDILAAVLENVKNIGIHV